MTTSERPTACRRDVLVENATDYALKSGLIGLTLRPIAAELGTSDRMLLYYFGTRSGLISTITNEAGRRSVVLVTSLPAGRTVRDGVHALWEAFQSNQLAPLLTIYLQAAATGLLTHEPSLSDARAIDASWSEAVRDYFARCGASPSRVERVATLVDCSLYGFFLNLMTEPVDELERGVHDLAEAANALAYA